MPMFFGRLDDAVPSNIQKDTMLKQTTTISEGYFGFHPCGSEPHCGARVSIGRKKCELVPITQKGFDEPLRNTKKEISGNDIREFVESTLVVSFLHNGVVSAQWGSCLGLFTLLMM